MPGWKTSIVECKTFESLPQNAKDYITKIEDFLHIPGKHILPVVIIYSNVYIFGFYFQSYLYLLRTFTVGWIGVGQARDAVITRM